MEPVCGCFGNAEADSETTEARLPATPLARHTLALQRDLRLRPYRPEDRAGVFALQRRLLLHRLGLPADAMPPRYHDLPGDRWVGNAPGFGIISHAFPFYLCLGGLDGSFGIHGIPDDSGSQAPAVVELVRRTSSSSCLDSSGSGVG